VQSGSQIPPDFQIGYGREVAASGGWADITAFLVVLSPLMIAAWLWYRKRKGKKR